jgi:hypothetical protein
MRLILIALLLAQLPLPESRETDWSRYIAAEIGGVAEAPAMGMRVDILTDDTAWEVEFAMKGKEYEAIGQAVLYSLATERPGGIILLMGRGPRDQELVSYWKCKAAGERCGFVVRGFDVKTREWK